MSEVKIKPLGTRVVIEAQVAETKTAGGIIIPDSAKENHNKEKLLLWVQELKMKKWN
jgi:chaperonin GroES